MDEQTLRYKLTIPLIEKDYGNNAAEVLQTCALVAEYTQEHTPDQVKAFQEKVKINPQVWLRLLALHRDERLKKHLGHLPASYTALYAVSRMKDEEIDAAVQQGVITPTASSHAILSWSKHNRLKRGETLLPWRGLIVFEHELDPLEFARMRYEMNQIARNYGARLTSESDYFQEDPDKIDPNSERIKTLEGKIRDLTRPLFESLFERELSELGVRTIDEFVYAPLRRIGPLLRTDTGTTTPRFTYKPEYIYRIVLEYLKTDSRSQRYNCKRRLQVLADANSDLQGLIEQVFENYMS